MHAHPPATLTASTGWLRAAARTVDRDAHPYLLAVHDQTQLVGLLTLTLENERSRPRLRFAGAPNNDLCDLLVRPGHAQAVANLIACELKRCLTRGWSVDLEAIEPGGQLHATLRDMRLFSWSPCEERPLINLHGDWPDIPSTRRRSQWDRKLRRLREQGPVALRRLEGTALLEELPQFLAIRGARRAVKHHDETPPDSFLRAVASELAPTGQCVLMELTVSGVAVAADLYLIDRPIAMMWLRGLDPAWRHFPCGHLLLRATAQALADDDFQALDLGRGNEPYKHYFATTTQVLLRATAPARNNET